MLSKTNELAKCICISLLLLLLGYNALAQKTVTGKVINNSDKQPIADATVQVKGTSTATQTKSDGSFSITVPQDNSVLVVTVVGFERIEIPVLGKTSLGDIPLTSTSASLNEVVVTGYTAQRKKDITGAVSVVNVNNLKSVPSGTTESLLQGQAAGVTVINSGAPGGGSVVRVRGITSVGSTDPLIIIDGTPGNLHDLNVNDIQSIQVLKDAGAAAIYGVRGSNGVIIVTTKRGQQGKAKITYDGYVGTQRPLKNGFNIANPTETANAIWQEYLNDSLQPVHKQYGSGPTPVIPDYITPPGAKEGDPNTDPSTYALYTNQITRANKEGTDWFHEIFKPALIQSHSISASGGGDKSTYLFSVGYFDQEGTLIFTSLKRYSARINTTFNIKDKIRVGENAYIFYKQNPGYLNPPGVNSSNAINASYRMPPIVPVYDIKGNFAGGSSQSLGNSPQPVAIQTRQANNVGNDWQMNGNVFAEVDFLKHFTARTTFGGTVDYFYNNAFIFTAYENAENATNPNSYRENYGWNSSWTWTNTLKYSNIFSEKHNLSVLVGSEAIRNKGRAIGASRGGYYITNPNDLTVDPNLWTLNFGQPGGQTNANIVSNNGIQTPYELAIYSLFGRLDYNFNDKYLLSGTVRRDGASVFASGNRYGIFPSVTAGWRISRESFMKDISWLNDLKIRGGWGKLGSISNILNNKFDISVEWYKKSITGLLFPVGLPGTAGGASAPFINSGNIENTGIDLTVTWHGVIKRDFKFDITGTFTSYNNKVVGLPPGVQYFDYGQSRLETGYPLGSYFGYKVLGIFQNSEEVAKSPVQDGARPGRFKYADVNGFDSSGKLTGKPDGKIDAADRTHFGNPNPDFTAGLNIGVSYKNFDFFIFLYASVGNDVINNVRNSTDFPQQFDAAMSKDVALNSWRPDRPDSKIPMLERISKLQ